MAEINRERMAWVLTDYSGELFLHHSNDQLTSLATEAALYNTFEEAAWDFLHYANDVGISLTPELVKVTVISVENNWQRL